MLKIDLNIDLIFDHRTSDLTGNQGVEKLNQINSLYKKYTRV